MTRCFTLPAMGTHIVSAVLIGLLLLGLVIAIVNKSAYPESNDLTLGASLRLNAWGLVALGVAVAASRTLHFIPIGRRNGASRWPWRRWRRSCCTCAPGCAGCTAWTKCSGASSTKRSSTPPPGRAWRFWRWIYCHGRLHARDSLRTGRALRAGLCPLDTRQPHLQSPLPMKNRLRDLRAAREWSQGDLAVKLGVRARRSTPSRPKSTTPACRWRSRSRGYSSCASRRSSRRTDGLRPATGSFAVHNNSNSKAFRKYSC